MVQMHIFEMSRFYALDAEDQQEVKDAIQVLYGHENLSNGVGLKHFVAQYFQIPKRKRNKINILVEKLYNTNYHPRSYAEYYDSTDYGIAQIRKMPRLFSERFVAYETGIELGVKGRLRFKVDCSAPPSIKQLQAEMNRAFLAKTVQQRSTAKVLKISFGAQQQVSKVQVELLDEMLHTCEAELLVDLCGQDTIKLKNPWGAVMIMKREAATGRTILTGDKTVIKNFSKNINAFF